MAAFPSCRAVITGIGCVSPFGLGGTEVVKSLLQTQTTAIAPLQGFSTETFSRHLGAEVSATEFVPDEEGRRWSRISQMSVAACRFAVAESRLADSPLLQSCGLVVGTEYGDLHSTEAFDAGFLQRGPRGLRAFLFPNTVMNSMAGLISLALGLKGPMLTLNQPGVAGELAVIRALALLEARRAQAVIACGVDELFSVLYEMLGRLNVLSPRDGGEETCRPFDRRHNGPVAGEGATALMLETPAHAQARGAPILAGVYGADWGALQTHSHRYPALAHLHHRLLKRTLTTAAITPKEIDIAYLSGSGDPHHDTAELALVGEVCEAEKPILTGVTHLSGEYGGLGALRVAAATLTATEGIVPTLGYLEQPLRGDVHFAKEWRTMEPSLVLVHGLARGGVQTALLIGPPPPQ